MAAYTVTLTDLEEAALEASLAGGTVTPAQRVQTMVTTAVAVLVPGYQASLQKSIATALAQAPLDAQQIALKLVTATPDVQSKAIDALKSILG